jgi:uncharacterized protein with GYD domain
LSDRGVLGSLDLVVRDGRITAPSLASRATIREAELEGSHDSSRQSGEVDRRGARAIDNFAETVAKVRETVTENGGSLEHAWQTAGIYDFVAVLNFPDLEAEFRSRNEVYKLGTIRVDHVPAIPLDEALKLHDSQDGRPGKSEDDTEIETERDIADAFE